MNIEDIKVNDAEVMTCPPDRSPIFFVNMTVDVKGVKAKTAIRYNVEKMVVKGTLDEIKKSDKTKTDFLKNMLEGSSKIKKQIEDFDLSRINIIGVEIITSLGYGVKSE